MSVCQIWHTCIHKFYTEIVQLCYLASARHFLWSCLTTFPLLDINCYTAHWLLQTPNILVTPHHFILLWHKSRMTILPWTFQEFLLELICILSRYNPTNFASDLTLTFCLTVTVCLNPPTGIYQRTVEKQWP